MGSLAHADPVTIAVIGAGIIGTKHASIIAESQDATLAAIVDPTPSGQKLAHLYNSKYFSDIPSLLRSQHKPSAAIICTPNATHVQIGKTLAANGIHLLVEKPLSTSYAEGLPLLQDCRERGVRICVGHHRRLNPLIAAAKASLAAGSVGKVLGVSGLWTSLKPQAYFDGVGAWHKHPAGGPILVNLIHEIDLLHFLVGPIVRVYAEKAPSTRDYEAEEGVAITLRFQNGAIGTFLALDNTASPFNIEGGTGENLRMYPYTGQDCYRVFGSEGTLSVPDNKLWKHETLKQGRNSKMKAATLDVREGDAFESQLTNLIGVVKGEQEPTCSGKAGLNAVAVCEAIANSLEDGIPVMVKSIDH